jgi:DNA gyrase subunit A
MTENQDPIIDSDDEKAAVQIAKDEQMPDMPLVGSIEESRFGRLKTISITNEMEKSYLDYAMSVIVSRALPDVRDGMKPVHRRILYSMYRSGFHHTSAYKKSARIVGDVLGRYHPRVQHALSLD